MDIEELAKDLGINKEMAQDFVNEFVAEYKKAQNLRVIDDASTKLLQVAYKQIGDELLKRQEKDRGEKLNQIVSWMRTILVKKENGTYRPIKNTTRQDCFEVLYKIQDLLGTNRL